MSYTVPEAAKSNTNVLADMVSLLDLERLPALCPATILSLMRISGGSLNLRTPVAPPQGRVSDSLIRNDHHAAT